LRVDDHAIPHLTISGDPMSMTYRFTVGRRTKRRRSALGVRQGIDYRTPRKRVTGCCASSRNTAAKLPGQSDMDPGRCTGDTPEERATRRIAPCPTGRRRTCSLRSTCHMRNTRRERPDESRAWRCCPCVGSWCDR
jgi:hypothetical protein